MVQVEPRMDTNEVAMPPRGAACALLESHSWFPPNCGATRNFRRCNRWRHPFYSAPMIRLFAALLTVAALSACSTPKEPLHQIPIAHANVVPLALEDDFKIEKVTKFLNDPQYLKPTEDEMLIFERQRVNYGAITAVDYGERRGYYFNVSWSAKRPADITARIEYRLENLGAHVQAKEMRFPFAKGSHVTKFTVIGDEYKEGGKITAWRVLLIENGRAVGLYQSFLWN